LPVLVSSKVYRQLEFLAVGTWWVYTPSNSEEQGSPSSSQGGTGITVGQGTLSRVPSGREDIFAAEELDMKTKRALMKFLRFIGDFENQGNMWEEHRQAPFSTILSEQFKVPVTLHAPLLALTLSPLGPDLTTTEFALPRVAIHLRSIGMFGPGFGAVIPRWGGLSEICQVACRAGAVGGAVYVLGNGLEGLLSDEHQPTGASTKRVEDSDYVEVALKGNGTVKARMVVGSSDDLEPLKLLRHESTERKLGSHEPQSFCRSITIVSAPLVELLPPLAEGATSPAGAVVFFPSGSLTGAGDGSTLPPVYVFVHSGDTGECPTNQSVLYATVGLPGESGVRLLEKAVESLLSCLKMQPRPTILWSLRYEQHYPSIQPPQNSALPHLWPLDKRILVLPPTSLDLVLDDSVLDQIKGVWQTIMGDEAGEFMKFDDREGVGADDEDDDP